MMMMMGMRVHSSAPCCHVLCNRYVSICVIESVRDGQQRGVQDGDSGAAPGHLRLFPLWMKIRMRTVDDMSSVCIDHSRLC